MWKRYKKDNALSLFDSLDKTKNYLIRYEYDDGEFSSNIVIGYTCDPRGPEEDEYWAEDCDPMNGGFEYRLEDDIEDDVKYVYVIEEDSKIDNYIDV